MCWIFCILICFYPARKGEHSKIHMNEGVVGVESLPVGFPTEEGVIGVESLPVGFPTEEGVVGET